MVLRVRQPVTDVRRNGSGRTSRSHVLGVERSVREQVDENLRDALLIAAHDGNVARIDFDALAALPRPLVPSPEARALAVEALVAVDAMLAALPEKVRRAFLLAQLDGLTYREVAARLGVS